MDKLELFNDFKDATSGMSGSALREYAVANRGVIQTLSRSILRRAVGQCSSCVIEAARLLAALTPERAHDLLTCVYDIRAGVVLRDVANTEMTCTRVSLTNERAEYFLTQDYARWSRYFTRGLEYFAAKQYEAAKAAKAAEEAETQAAEVEAAAVETEEVTETQEVETEAQAAEVETETETNTETEVTTTTTKSRKKKS